MSEPISFIGVMVIPGLCVAGIFLALLRVLSRTGHSALTKGVVSALGLIFFLPLVFSAATAFLGVRAEQIGQLQVSGFALQMPGAIIVTALALWIAFKSWPDAPNSGVDGRPRQGAPTSKEPLE